MESASRYGNPPTFRDICNQMAELNIRKSGDYGDAFSDQVREFGDIAAIIPMTNKLERIKNIVRKGEVNNESLRDSVIDLACYAVMYLQALDGRGYEED